MTVLVAITLAGITISWTPNLEPDLNKYKVYVGEISQVYSGSAFTADTFFVWKSLPKEKRYYFAVSAIDNSGNESLLSNEVSIFYSSTIPPVTIIPETPTFSIKGDSAGVVKVKSGDTIEMTVVQNLLWSDMTTMADSLFLGVVLETAQGTAFSQAGTYSRNQPKMLTLALPEGNTKIRVHSFTANTVSNPSGELILQMEGKGVITLNFPVGIN